MKAKITLAKEFRIGDIDKRIYGSFISGGVTGFINSAVNRSAQMLDE